MFFFWVFVGQKDFIKEGVENSLFYILLVIYRGFNDYLTYYHYHQNQTYIYKKKIEKLFW